MRIMTDDKFKAGYYYKFIGDNTVKERAKEYFYIPDMYKILERNWHQCIGRDGGNGTRFDFGITYLSYIDKICVPYDSFVECSPDEYEKIKDINWEVGATYKYNDKNVIVHYISYKDSRIWFTDDTWVEYDDVDEFTKVEKETKLKDKDSFFVKVISKEKNSYWYDIGKVYEVVDIDDTDYGLLKASGFINKSDCVIVDDPKTKPTERPFKHGDQVIVMRNKDQWIRDYVGCLWRIGDIADLDNYTHEHFRLATGQEKIKHSLGLKPTAEYVTKENGYNVYNFEVGGVVVRYNYHDPLGMRVSACKKDEILDYIKESTMEIDIFNDSVTIAIPKHTSLTVTLPSHVAGQKIAVSYDDVRVSFKNDDYESFSHKYVNRVDNVKSSKDIEYKSFSSKYIDLNKEK